MLYKKTNQVGIDVEIQKAQTLLHDKLCSSWGADISAYGRVYLLKRKETIVPEVFVGGVDYKDVLSLDDNRFFFIQSNTSTRISNTRYECDVDIYFILNLKDVKSSINHRADEEVHRDVEYLLNQTYFETKSLEIGIDNVISDFKLEDRDNFNISDFEPYHIFKYVCSVKYDISKTGCNG